MTFSLYILHARSIYCVIWDQIYSQIGHTIKCSAADIHKTDVASLMAILSSSQKQWKHCSIDAQPYHNGGTYTKWSPVCFLCKNISIMWIENQGAFRELTSSAPTARPPSLQHSCTHIHDYDVKRMGFEDWQT